VELGQLKVAGRIWKNQCRFVTTGCCVIFLDSESPRLSMR